MSKQVNNYKKYKYKRYEITKYEYRIIITKIAKCENMALLPKIFLLNKYSKKS